MLAVEVLHNFGMVLLLLRVLPNFGSIYAVGIIHSICLVPALLALIFVRRKVIFEHCCSRSLAGSLARYLLDFVAFLLELCAIAMPVIICHFGLVSPPWASDYMLQNMQTSTVSNETVEWSNYTCGWWPPTQVSHMNVQLYWEMPLALVLVSLKWWENFVDKDRCCLNLFQAKSRLHVTRTRLNLILCPINVGVIFGSWYLIEYLQDTVGTGIPVLLGIPQSVDVVFASELTPGIICIFCGLVCYFMFRLASRLLMQCVSVCVPLFLAMPTVVAVILLQCHDILPPIKASSTLTFEFRCDVQTKEYYGYYVVGAAVWWLVFMWINRHVWFPTAEKLAKTEK